MMMVNSLAWVLYSLLLKDYYILIPNILGVDFGLYYSLSTFRYSSTLAQHSTIRTIIGFSTFLFIGTGCTFISVGDFKTQSTLLGLLCVIVLICFYSSPLSTILKVVETKNSASIDPLLAWAT